MRIFSLLCLALFFMAVKSAAGAAESTLYQHGMVVSEQKDASVAGAEILRQGGNAIDAAVATGYALAVVNPCCGNIGGGGFMTIHLANGENIFLNFREKAPLKAMPDMYLNLPGNATTNGYLAVAVPGTVLGLDTVLQKYGTMNRQQIMAPAISLAEKGYNVTSFDARNFAQYADDFKSQPNIAAIFLHNGRPYRAGERLVQKDLAQTLKSIMDQGSQVFYHGPIAQAIAEASSAHGGILTVQDFANYSVEFLQPIQCTYRGYTIISAPPPSSGGVTLCEMLNILENFPLNDFRYGSGRSIQVITEAMRYGFLDRNTKLGDPDFISNPIEELTSKPYARMLSDKILVTFNNPSTDEEINNYELTDTTHYSVVDSKGNAVAVTYTLNGFFGAKVIAKNTGFFLNDEMDDFATVPGKPNKFGLVQYDTNAIAPGKRPLSSMAPTIVMKDGKVLLVLGSPGGPRIISAVLLTLINVLDYGMTIQEAVDAPRFHYQSQPDTIFTEPFAMSFGTQLYMELLGYRVTPQSTWSAVEAIQLNPADGSLHGANDDRRSAGAAIGY